MNQQNTNQFNLLLNNTWIITKVVVFWSQMLWYVSSWACQHLALSQPIPAHHMYIHAPLRGKVRWPNRRVLSSLSFGAHNTSSSQKIRTTTITALPHNLISDYWPNTGRHPYEVALLYAPYLFGVLLLFCAGVLSNPGQHNVPHTCSSRSSSL